jgi:transmembrane sensor
MSNVHDLSNHQHAQYRASEWLAKLERGLSAEEQLRLDEWLLAKPENREALLALSSQWDDMDELARLAEIFPEREYRKEKKQWQRPSAILSMGFVLVIALLVGAWGAGRLLVVPAADIASSQVENRFDTGRGEQSTVTLLDGSQLTLNTNTRIRTVYTTLQRQIYLERGEVHIQVAHNQQRPFIVYVGDQMVRAVGTAFNLEIKADKRVELIVTEGKVLVGARRRETLAGGHSIGKKQSEPVFNSVKVAPVAAGQRMLLGDAVEKVQSIQAEDVRAQLAWQKGSLVFRGESLEEAIAEIERYTPVEFVIQDEDLKRLRVAGLFRTGDVEGLLASLKENFNVTSQRISAEKVILTRR